MYSQASVWPVPSITIQSQPLVCPKQGFPLITTCLKSPSNCVLKSVNVVLRLTGNPWAWAAVTTSCQVLWGPEYRNGFALGVFSIYIPPGANHVPFGDGHTDELLPQLIQSNL